MKFFKKILPTALCAMGICAGAVPAEAPPLTHVAEIRGLSGEEAAKAVPVRLRATVNFIDYGDGWFKVHDGVEAISVDLNTAKRRGIWAGGDLPKSENALGAVIEIEGVTGPGSYSPVILPTRFRRVGSAPVPPARSVSMEQLISGSEVSQLVEVEGVVWGIKTLWDGKTGMALMVEGHLCELEFMQRKGVNRKALVDARVRVRGFCRPIANFRSEAVRIRLTVTSIEELTVLRPPPADPFKSDRVPLGELLAFSRKPERFHRKVTRGIVNFVLPGHFFFLQEGTSGVRVESSAENISVGDVVEVAGFVDTSRSIASLTGAVARRVGTKAVPAPEPVSIENILRPEITRRSQGGAKDYAGGVVRLSGQLSDMEWREFERTLTLFLIADGHRFKVFLPSPDARVQKLWNPGSEIEVTGVCEMEFKPVGVGARGAIVNDFSIWLRTPQDVTVLRAASWWTPLRLGLTLGGTIAILMVTSGWVWLLRRQVSRQMEIISQKLREEAVSSERNRIARDLHDNLEQQLAGVALQLDGAEETIQEDPAFASGAVRLARRMLRHTQAEARRSVWDLRSQVLQLQGLPAALEALAESARSRSGPAITVQIAGENPQLSAAVQFQLLRVAQEALANALKHSGAKTISISLRLDPDSTCLRIRDDGRGFTAGALTREPEPHFGVLGMQERAARLGAAISIVGAPGEGCLVELTLSHQRSTPDPLPA